MAKAIKTTFLDFGQNLFLERNDTKNRFVVLHNNGVLLFRNVVVFF